MENTILNKSNSLLKNIGKSVFESIFGEREYEDEEKKQINSEEDILKLMNESNDGKNANNDIAKNKEISKILLSGLKEAEQYNCLIQGIPSRKTLDNTKISNQTLGEKGKAVKGKEKIVEGKEVQHQQKDDKEIGDK